MKVLIFYAMAGGGHKMAAQALADALAAQGDEVCLDDSMKRAGRFVNWFCCDVYKWLAKHWPRAFGFAYRCSDKKTGFGRFVPWVTAKLSKRLLPLLEEFKPDVVVSTFHFAAQMISALREQGRTDVPLVCMLTDYAPCMPWICKNLDAYITAAEDMLPQMTERGAAAEQVYPFGIPVRAAFLQKEEKKAARRQLGLSENLPVVLIMAGSFGVKKSLGLYEHLAAAELPVQFVVITGNNEALRQGFTEAAARYPNVRTRVEGFRADVQHFMFAADLLVTKPGGLTVSEALACGLPLAVFDAIPGQEEENAFFLEKRGMAIRLEAGRCGEQIRALLQESGRLEEMRAACRAFDKSDAVPRTRALLEKLAGGRKEPKKNPDGFNKE